METEKGGQTPILRTLARLAKENSDAFDQYIKRLNADVRTAENDQSFYKVITDMYSGLQEHNDGKWEVEGMALAKLSESQSQQASAYSGIVCAMSKLTPEMQKRILQTIRVLVGNGGQPLQQMVGVVNGVGGEVGNVGLCAVYLSFDAIKNLRLWWKGEITGKRCAKNIIDATFTVSAGAGGGIAGAAIGAFLGPLGTIVGGLLGGIISSNVAEMLVDALTKKIFDLPKDVAKEKAYNFLGLSHSASSADINAAFRRLCRETHPDKTGGNSEKFLELQSNMAIIKMHRGEMP